MRKLFLVLFLLPSLVTLAQTKDITLEDIYKKATFRGEFVPATFAETKKDPVKIVDRPGKTPPAKGKE